MVDGVLYSFGHGLSYTTFEYQDITIKPEIQTPDGEIIVSCHVKNNGNLAGDEVVRLYLSDLVSSVTTYVTVLRGFEKIHLEPGEIRKVTFNLTPEDLMILDRNMKWTVEPGDFEVKIGSSSQNLKLFGKFSIHD